ncbi:MAG: hybrid sensor histidine kinase/response regulator [Alphaproteobacteria bacterium]
MASGSPEPAALNSRPLVANVGRNRPGVVGLDDPMSRLPRRDGLPSFRVAVVDDDEIDFLNLKRMLRDARRARFELTHISSLDAAISRLPSDLFDVALVDNVLDGSPGVELIRELGGRNCAIPMLLLTAGGDDTAAIDALQAGVADFIDKNEMTAAQIERAIIYAYVRHDVESELVRSQQLLRLARDEARQANAAKSDFLARMSHELRTPLNAINGYAEMLSGQFIGPLGNPKYREYADNILTSGHLLLDLINDLLDLSRIESGRLRFHFDAIDIEGELRALLETFFAQASSIPITLKAEIEDGLPTVLADRRAFKQVAINLLSNALKFTGPHGLVTVRAHRQGQRVAVSVSDTGVGVDPDQIPRLFTPFVQADVPFVRNTNGTGLGLAIVKSLVETHGGTVSMASEPGVGTVVSTDWPVAGTPKSRRATRGSAA